jgi:hypothetical protein
VGLLGSLVKATAKAVTTFAETFLNEKAVSVPDPSTATSAIA